MPLDTKSVRGSSNGEEQCADEHVSESFVDDKDTDPFYTVFAMNGVLSPDEARYNWEDSLETLSYDFRDHPTLPSDFSDKTRAVSGALDTDKALVLPLKHCAFKHCSWCGDDDESLTKHLSSDHMQALRPCMEAFTSLRPVAPRDAEVLVMSVYNEALAIAIRKGAPLASYSIDRRCLRQYVQHVSDATTYAAVCFVCARRFVHVSGVNKNNDIEYMPLLTRDVKEDLRGECDFFRL